MRAHYHELCPIIFVRTDSESMTIRCEMLFTRSACLQKCPKYSMTKIDLQEQMWCYCEANFKSISLSRVRPLMVFTHCKLIAVTCKRPRGANLLPKYDAALRLHLPD